MERSCLILTDGDEVHSCFPERYFGVWSLNGDIKMTSVQQSTSDAPNQNALSEEEILRDFRGSFRTCEDEDCMDKSQKHRRNLGIQIGRDVEGYR